MQRALSELMDQTRDLIQRQEALAQQTEAQAGEDEDCVQRLLAAHGETMPEGVGAALGFDRLVMLAAGADSIAAVRSFSGEA